MTPADRWANVLLDRVLAKLQQPGPPGDGFAWWQGQEAIDLLTYPDEAVFFQGSRLSIGDRKAVVVYLVSPTDPNRLQQAASIQVDSSALVLSVTSLQPDHADTQWILGGSPPDTALQALVIQAAARSTVLRVAYSPGDDRIGEIVLIGAQPLSGPVQTPIGTASPGPAITLSPATSPTPTHAPEGDLGVMIEARLKPVFDVGLSFPPDVVTKYTASHAWNGSLMWDETGPLVDGRPVNVDQASELILQILTPNDPRGPVQPFLKADYTGVVTRFPDEQIYFSGQRMNEVLYWIVLYGARRGGLLNVSYDDFGARQLITIIGFAPFGQTQTATPKP
jgi:hypothetical protein